MKISLLAAFGQICCYLRSIEELDLERLDIQQIRASVSAVAERTKESAIEHAE